MIWPGNASRSLAEKRADYERGARRDAVTKTGKGEAGSALRGIASSPRSSGFARWACSGRSTSSRRGFRGPRNCHSARKFGAALSTRCNYGHFRLQIAQITAAEQPITAAEQQDVGDIMQHIAAVRRLTLWRGTGVSSRTTGRALFRDARAATRIVQRARLLSHKSGFVKQNVITARWPDDFGRAARYRNARFVSGAR